MLAWLKRPGEAVERGEPLVEVETDKATIVYEAEADGVLDEILVGDGQTAALGAPIARAAHDRRHRHSRPAPLRRPLPPADGGTRSPVAHARRPSRGGSRGARRLTRRRRRLRAWRPHRRRRRPGRERGRRAAVGPRRGDARPLTPTQRTIARRMAESRSSIPEFTSRPRSTWTRPRACARSCARPAPTRSLVQRPPRPRGRARAARVPRAERDVRERRPCSPRPRERRLRGRRRTTR